MKIRKKNLTNSSKKWIIRQNNDKYSLDAKTQGFRSRAVFKLQEINKKFKIINSKANILDLGCAPGSWLQYLIKNNCKKVLGIDLIDIKPLSGLKFIKGDFSSNEVKLKIRDYFVEGIDVILSDIAFNTTGNKNFDSFKTNSLALEVLKFGKSFLNKKGCLLTKYFNGELDKELISFARASFNSFKLIKPKCSRSESKEMYLFCSLN